jgi:hypothetical protein
MLRWVCGRGLRTWSSTRQRNIEVAECAKNFRHGGHKYTRRCGKIGNGHKAKNMWREAVQWGVLVQTEKHGPERKLSSLNSLMIR